MRKKEGEMVAQARQAMTRGVSPFPLSMGEIDFSTLSLARHPAYTSRRETSNKP